MATSEADLINFVLDNFSAIGSGQSASAEDTAKVLPYIELVLAELAESGVTYIPGSDSVPDAAVPWVAALIAHSPGLRRHFGEPVDLPSAEYCLHRLRRIKPEPEYPTLQATFF